MKKEDLRKAFGKIRPDETLIDDTLDLIRTGEKRSAKRGSSSFSFTYRLAGAMCAFALMIGVGVAFGKDIVLSPSDDTPEAYEREAFNSVDTLRPFAAPSGMEADMPAEISKAGELTEDELNAKKAEAVAELESVAEAIDGEWTIVYGALDGCYFVSDGCVAAISVEEICGGIAIELADNALIADIEFGNDSQKQSFSDAIGSCICLLVTEDSDGGSVSYKVSDWVILK